MNTWASLSKRDFSDSAFALGLAHGLGACDWLDLFELFGHRHNVVGDSMADRRAYFEFELDVLADLMGID